MEDQYERRRDREKEREIQFVFARSIFLTYLFIKSNEDQFENHDMSISSMKINIYIYTEQLKLENDFKEYRMNIICENHIHIYIYIYRSQPNEIQPIREVDSFPYKSHESSFLACQIK